MALDLLGEMRSAELQPDFTFNADISACEKCSEWQLALGLLGEMRSAKLQPASGSSCGSGSAMVYDYAGGPLLCVVVGLACTALFLGSIASGLFGALQDEWIYTADLSLCIFLYLLVIGSDSVAHCTGDEQRKVCSRFTGQAYFLLVRQNECSSICMVITVQIAYSVSGKDLRTKVYLFMLLLFWISI